MQLAHRERVLKAVSHQMADRVPRDLGGTFTSTIARGAHDSLLQYLGMEGESKVIRKWARAVRPDERVLARFDIDTRMVTPRHDDSWNEYWRLSPMSPESTRTDEWGVTWRRPETGPWFISNHPLKAAQTINDLDMHPFWPDPEDDERYYGLKEQARRLKEETDYAVIGVFPRPVVSLSQFLRGYDTFFMDLALNHVMLEAVMDRILDLDLRIGERILSEIGSYVDIMFVHDDLATQESLMFSPDHYRKFVKPRHKKIFDCIKTHSDAKILFHTDGAIRPLLDDLIEIGVDALNPIQVSAAGMEPEKLAADYGNRLCFWGGMDTQRVLNTGKPGEVRAEVRNLVRSLGGAGNYVIAAVHNIQDDVPPENVIALFDAAEEFGIY
ncbi:MAG TPA: hypothetical protein ENN79_11730 [Desulfobacteraceae bacterium]|nr:hypothetical protein [Desulfobacteraceae bacterium]